MESTKINIPQKFICLQYSLPHNLVSQTPPSSLLAQKIESNCNSSTNYELGSHTKKLNLLQQKFTNYCSKEVSSLPLLLGGYESCVRPAGSQELSYINSDIVVETTVIG